MRKKRERAEKPHLVATERPHLLDICITHWTEAWEIGRKGVEMLGMQRMVDWSQVQVWMIHDGSDLYPEEYFMHLPFRMHQVALPHGGIASARNWTLDHLTGTWIKWCDFDDMFAGIYSVHNMAHAMEDADKYDLLWFDMYAEETDGRTRYLKDNRDPVVIHNKAFRRSWLREAGIRFNEELIWCEDSAFLALVEMDIDHQRIGKIKADAPIYGWICREGSLCNRPEIKFANEKSFFQRHRYVQEEFLKRGHHGPACCMALRIMADSFRVLTMEEHPDATVDEIMAHARAVKDYYREHRKDLLEVPRSDYELAIRAVERESGTKINQEKFLQWLRSLRDGIREEDEGHVYRG